MHVLCELLLKLEAPGVNRPDGDAQISSESLGIAIVQVPRLEKTTLIIT